MKFRFLADAQFEAENICDAFAKLAEHFSCLAEDGDSDLLVAGFLSIDPE